MHIKTVRGKVAFGSSVTAVIAAIIFAAIPEPSQDSYWYWPYASLVAFICLGILGAVVGRLLMSLGDPIAKWSVKGLLSVLQAVGAWLLSVVIACAFAGALFYVGSLVFEPIYEHYTTEWSCVEKRQTMYSISDKGDIGPAEEACTCTGMADFERRKFGRVDYAGLNKDHGCDFD